MEHYILQSYFALHVLYGTLCTSELFCPICLIWNTMYYSVILPYMPYMEHYVLKSYFALYGTLYTAELFCPTCLIWSTMYCRVILPYMEHYILQSYFALHVLHGALCTSELFCPIYFIWNTINFPTKKKLAIYIYMCVSVVIILMLSDWWKIILYKRTG